uniref:Si:ch211-253p14.2 n=1 Tax=Neogobius melanostomus TaxID=47308 RepID=A0A8C6WJ13_9GOBI
MFSWIYFCASLRSRLHSPRTLLPFVIGDTSFLEEKGLLVQGCEYFQALYRSGMKECYQEKIHLQCLQARGFLIALAVLRGEQPILDTSDDIVDAIEYSNNCLLMYHAAATYGLMELYRKAAQFIRDTYTSRTICYLDDNSDSWDILTDLPLEASSSLAGVTVLDNILYIVGGVHGAHKEVVNIASPNQLRYNFSLIGHDGRLYAIGGECDRVAMSSVESYDIEKNTWRFVAHLPRPGTGVACTKAIGRIFVCLWRPMETTEIFEYNQNRDTWQLLTTLIRKQSYGHCMVGHRDNLYIMRNGPSADFLRCLMECYNLTTGQWTSLPGHYVNSKGSLFTAVVRGDSVLTLNRSTTLEYVVDGNSWKTRRHMKGFPRSGSVWTFLLRLPEKKKV